MTRRAKNPTLRSFDMSRLAPEHRRRLIRGLERFANAGDTLEAYKALSKAWTAFWPSRIQTGPSGESQVLDWQDECHGIFLVYRDALRSVWSNDPRVLKEEPLMLLLGLDNALTRVERGAILTGTLAPLNDAWRQLAAHYPNAYQASYPFVCAIWATGDFDYSPLNDFQLAAYMLFRESWRAKVCLRCSQYFVAGKPAQLYCSSACSNAAHRDQALNYWRAEGAARRSARRNKPQAKDRVERTNR